MNKIEITTPQNVTIEYQLASSLQRVLAQIIDTVIMLVAFISIGLFWNKLFPYIIHLSRDAKDVLSFISIITVFVFYDILFESYNNGQSLGKMAIGIRVIRLDGESITRGSTFSRWAFKLIDVYLSWGIFGLLFSITTEKTQRLGDIVGGTTLIRNSKKMGRMSLQHILGIQKTTEYTPKYPQVTQFTNEEMLLIKETSDRAKKYNNDAHNLAVKKLAEKIETQLNVKPVKNKQQFFQHLIRDYVFLTR